MYEDYIDKGKLQINALSEGNDIPVADAQVRISTPDGKVVVEGLKTDSSGRTEFVELAAPPIEYSITESDKKPYATYNVLVTAPDFEKVYTSGIEVLSTQYSTQSFRLKAAPAGELNVSNLLVLPHTLWGEYPAKIPEAEVKKLPEASGLVVLPEPVVPQYMIVHLGVPDDDSAENVKLQFTDYIKNVASSEIYSTWNIETLKANILAIVSFALSRVFTEWYRGKGKNFTITNSTAYDQAFRKNGTIFREIARVVDDLFTTYVTREGIRQPLFTQFCDGRRVTCKGLSQWGSQTLGQQGLEAIEILKNYYGPEIFLAAAKKVEGIPMSYAGTPLKNGSTGEAVRTIQSQLNTISNNFPAIPKLRVDGIYSDSTENAVKIFQQIFNLPQTGIVDFGTWYQISNIYVAVTKMA